MEDPKIDIHSLLQAGSFPTARSRSPRQPATYVSAPSESPISSTFDGRVPRSLPGTAQSAQFTQSSSYPPPPSVEDEVASLAREVGSELDIRPDEEALFRGEIDQDPVIIDINLDQYNQNPERGFVLVSNLDKSRQGSRDSRSSSDSSTPRASNPYEANTTRKYDTKSGRESPLKRSSSERRKSRQDLPPIHTRFDANPASPRHSRSHSAYPSNEQSPERRDYRTATRRTSPPRIVKSGGGSSGREQPYYRAGSFQNNTPDWNRSTPHLRKPLDDDLSRSPQLPVPNSARRDPSRAPPKSADGRYAESLPNRRDYMPHRRSPSPPTRRGERDPSRRAPTPRRRGSVSKSNKEYSTDEESNYSRRTNHRRPKSIVVQDAWPPETLLIPDLARQPLSGRSRSKAPQSPMPSPTSRDETIVPGPRSSATFPIRRGDDGPVVLPYPDDDDIPPRGYPPSARDNDRSVPPYLRGPHLTMPMPMPIPIPAPAGPRSPPHSRRAAPPSPSDPTTPLPGSVGDVQPRSWQITSVMGSSTSEPPAKAAQSFRQVYNDVFKGARLSDLECKRVAGVSGKSDWLALPGCAGFDICPDCFIAFFAKTEFRSLFKACSVKPRDWKIACDFGGSGWYRVAWALTVKNRIPDLHLFEGLADVVNEAAEKRQRCPGPRTTVRTWYSLLNPATGFAAADFMTCFECANSIESLLPGLKGSFVRMDLPKGTKGTCSMYYGPDRKRFALYFDEMEKVCTRARVLGRPPDLKVLSQNIEWLSRFVECKQSRPVTDAKWHIMEGLPEFSVCGECFDEVVHPQISGNNNLVRDFYMRPQRLATASCQLHSRRMRDIFHRACLQNDTHILESAVLDRRRVQMAINSRLSQLDKANLGEERTKQEVDELIREWKKWE